MHSGTSAMIERYRARRRWLFAAWTLIALVGVPSTVAAYVGPGAGVAVATTAFAFLSTLMVVTLGVFFWPARWAWRRVKLDRPEGTATIKRAVIVGLDGIDPRRVKRLIDEGRLPNMAKIAERGNMQELETTFPAMSPVAWSSFSTGVNPGKHGIFDFLTRDPKTYLPHLSSADVRPSSRVLKIAGRQIPIGKPNVRLLKKSRPFWTVLSKYGISSSILRVPITFPPDRFEGSMLSAMCVPDLQGTQGTFSHIVADAAEEQHTEMADDPYAVGNTISAKKNAEGKFEATLDGPPDPFDPEGKRLQTTVTLELLDESSARVTLPTGELVLKLGEYTPWTEIAFKTAFGISMRGISRLRLMNLDPLELYVSPVNIDPARPMLPISHPRFFSIFLSKLVGQFATLGFAEDTWALNEGVLDDQAFLDQAWLNHAERESMLLEMLKRTPRGLVTCVFDGTDRIQHMFYRYTDPDHPARKGADLDGAADVIDECYERCDQTLGKVLAQVDVNDPKNLVIVMSDHGFESFRRGVNLNVWLRENGYLSLVDDDKSGSWFRGVDWENTKAFALGLGGIFLNVEGREALGCVPASQAEDLAKEIAAKLEQLKDPEFPDATPIRKVHLATDVYEGPYVDEAPSLIVGYDAGYRASWDGARGICLGPVVEDNTKAWSGDHCIDPDLVPGVVVSSHPLRTPATRRAAIIDIAPTVLELFGVRVPKYMDGSSLTPAAKPAKEAADAA